MSMFKRTIQDRCFAIFLSVVLMIPTGWGLWMYFTLDHSRDSQDWISKLFLHLGMETIGISFMCGVLGVVWAIFLPAWIDRVVRFAVDHFVKALAALLCIILGMFVFAWITLY
jgi:predicted permease